MSASAMRFFFALLTFVTIGMIVGAVIQVAFIGRLEESSGIAFSLTRIQSMNDSSQKRASVSHWDDGEATTLRLGHIKPEIISWSPRITLFHNFLSAEECDYLISIARPFLRSSSVVDKRTGKAMKSKVRTSSGMALVGEDWNNYHTIQAIEKRISLYSHVPVENGEFMQVLRYEKSQYYKPHFDYFQEPFNLMRGGQRIATMLMYLSDNVKGGETYFPQAGFGKCSCGAKMVPGLCVKPVKGNAILFWSTGLDGQLDPNSLHGGCEVLEGEKWSATKWMRQYNFTR